MAYLGQKPATGEDNSFKTLDDITSYTLTFDAGNSAILSTSDNTITSLKHRFLQGQRVKYTNGGGSNIGGLTNNSFYFVIKNDRDSIKLATNAANAAAGTAINFSGRGAGGSHTLNAAFDGINKKFLATHSDGTNAKITRAAQLTISINGVLQQPFDTKNPTSGYGLDNGAIVFSVAPTSTDVFWGNLVANNFPTFDISDNTIDNFVGNGSAKSFTMSKIAPNNGCVLVSLDGVVKHPDSSGNQRSYNVGSTGTSNVIEFSVAPGNGVEIQVRHIGFAAANSSDVTGFYGRTGNVTLGSADNITVKSVTSSDGYNIGIQSGGSSIITTTKTLNFIGTGNTFLDKGGGVVDISIAGGGGGSGAFTTSVTGIQTTSSIVGFGTTNTDDADLQGVGNTARGLYISNGMMIVDNELNGNHYIGTNFNGLMAGPVTVNGLLSVDGNYVVV